MQQACRPAALLCLLLAPLLQSSRALRLGVLVPSEEAAAAGHHDLGTLADTLRERGHDVRTINTAEQDSPGWEAAIPQPGKLPPAFDAILASGSAAADGEVHLAFVICCMADACMTGGPSMHTDVHSRSQWRTMLHTGARR